MLIFSRQIPWLRSILKSVIPRTERRGHRRRRSHQDRLNRRRGNWTAGQQWCSSLVESLEGRVLLTELIAVSLDVEGNLLVQDTSTSGLADNLTLQAQANELAITDPDNVLVTSVGTQISNHEIRVPLAAITNNRVLVNLNQGKDRLVAASLGATSSPKLDPC